MLKWPRYYGKDNWNHYNEWSSTHSSYKANINLSLSILIASPSLQISNKCAPNPSRFSLLFFDITCLGYGWSQISQKLWSTQHVTITFVVLSTIGLKCPKILHLFYSEPKAFSITTLPLFMLESYFILFTSIGFLVFQFFLQICSNWIRWITNDVRCTSHTFDQKNKLLQNFSIF